MIHICEKTKKIFHMTVCNKFLENNLTGLRVIPQYPWEIGSRTPSRIPKSSAAQVP